MRILISLLMICLGAKNSFAHISSISAGTGSAGRGVSEPLENPYLNPAALPFQKGYYFGMGFARLNTEIYGPQDLISLALTDNLPDTILPTSLAYTESKNSVLGREGLRRDIRIGVGNYYSPKSAFGIALNYRTSKSPTFSKAQLNATIGAMFPVRKDIGLGFVFENIIATDADLPASERLDPTMSVGLSYNYQRFVRLRADLISQPGNNMGKPILAAGVENYWNRWIIFRLGGQRDLARELSTESIGLGFAGPKFELQYAFQNIRGGLEAEARHSVDLGLPIW